MTDTTNSIELCFSACKCQLCGILHYSGLFLWKPNIASSATFWNEMRIVKWWKRKETGKVSADSRLVQSSNVLKWKIGTIFILISLNICCGCPKETSQWDGSFEHPLHMFWLRNKKNNFQLHALVLEAWYLDVSSLRINANWMLEYWIDIYCTQLCMVNNRLQVDVRSL